MNLSKRMLTVANMVSRGSRVADIGCDHAYVSIYLIEHQIAEHVIAMDVRKGPLAAALHNIKEQGLEEKIETRLSDGFEKLCPGEADCAVIAGMGGPLMIQILTANVTVTDSLKEMILQPQSDLPGFRHFLQDNGFCIEEEKIIFDMGKYYFAMRVKRGNMNLSERDFMYGKDLSYKKDPVLYEYLNKERKTLENIQDRLLKEHTQKAEKKQMEIKEHIRINQEALACYEMC